MKHYPTSFIVAALFLLLPASPTSAQFVSGEAQPSEATETLIEPSDCTFVDSEIFLVTDMLPPDSAQTLFMSHTIELARAQDWAPYRFRVALACLLLQHPDISSVVHPGHSSSIRFRVNSPLTRLSEDKLILLSMRSYLPDSTRVFTPSVPPPR